MPNDVDSMNPGKKMAQASHAANAFVRDALDVYGLESDRIFERAFLEWCNETPQGFGTVIVLQIPYHELHDKIRYIRELGNVQFNEFNTPTGIVTDPTYPISDGTVTHVVSFDTCGYVFVNDTNNRFDIVAAYLKENFELHD